MKRFKSIILIIILIISCSFTLPNKMKNFFIIFPKLIGNNVIISYNNKTINLSNYNYYYLNDNEFTNKIVANNIPNKDNILDITIDFLGNENNIEINLLEQNDLNTLCGYISVDLIKKLNVKLLTPEDDLFEKLVNNKYNSDNYKSKKPQTNNYVIVRNDYNNFGGGSSTVQSIDTLKRNFSIRDFSNNKVDYIFQNLSSGLSTNGIKNSSITSLIDVDALLQNEKYFLVNNDVIVFIDSKEICYGKHANYVCIIKIENNKNDLYKNVIKVTAYRQYYIIAAIKEKFGVSNWEKCNYESGLGKLAYIDSVSTIYSIVDVDYKTSLEHTTNIYDQNYDIYKDAGAFINQYEREYKFSKIANNAHDKVLQNIVKFGLSQIKYIGDIIDVISIFEPYFVEEITPSKETNGHIKYYFGTDRKYNINQNNGKLMRYLNDHALIEDLNENGAIIDGEVMKFHNNDYIEFSTMYSSSNISTKMRFQNLIDIKLRHTYANPTVSYSSNTYKVRYLQDYNSYIGGENNV